MKKKATRKNKNKVARLRKQTVLRKPIRKKTVARKKKPMKKAAVEPKELRSNAGGLGSLPEDADAGGEPIVDVIEILEVVPEETEGDVM